MKILIGKIAKKELDRVSKSEILKIRSKILNLKNFPEVDNIKKLKLFQDLFRLRSGNYRVVFKVENDVIKITHIRLRNEKTYKNL
jgi:mRNA interferase RelE/StbE